MERIFFQCCLGKAKYRVAAAKPFLRALERFGKLLGPTSIELGELLVGVFEAGRFEELREFLGKAPAKAARRLCHHVSHEVNRASLTLGFGQVRAHRFGQAFVFIGDHQAHAREAASTELREQLPDQLASDSCAPMVTARSSRLPPSALTP